MPTVIDVHVHLCRTPEQEAIVFPRRGLPLEWRWANGDACGEYMTRNDVEAIVGLNYMVVPEMFEQQRASAAGGVGRRSSGDAPRAGAQLQHLDPGAAG